MKFSDMAREQENAAARGDTEYISRQLPILLETFERLLSDIGRFLEERRQSDGDAERLPALSAGELKEQVEKALDELEGFRSRECAATVEAILLHHLPKVVEDSLRQIQEQLKLYEDDFVEELLRELISSLEREEDENG